MAEHTEIAWCDATWSPWEGCQKVGPGCDHCYAEARNRRFSKGANWGPGAPRRRTADWDKPRRWNSQAEREGRRLRVFPSLCDPFDNAVPDEWRADLFDLIARTPHLDWLLLTKRIGNAAAMIREAVNARWRADPAAWPGPNVWLGATVVNQEEADRDIPKLLATPARVRGLSIEPMLGPIDLRQLRGFHNGCTPQTHDCLSGYSSDTPWGYIRDKRPDPFSRGRVDWVICGGESGPHARPMHPDWARSLRDQCAAAGVPFFFKQWGEWAPPAKLEDLRHLGDMMRAGKAVHVYGPGREQDGHFRRGDEHLLRVGKKAAGRLLDGVEHSAFPEAS